MDDETQPTCLVLDANVLIDYWTGNRALLRHISTNLAPILFPSPVQDEVEQLTDRQCRALQLESVEPDLAQLAFAAAQGGRLSLQDHLCWLLAQERDATCVTNDVPLRAECQARQIPVWWGLEPMVALVRLGSVTPRVALRAVRKMQAANPHYLTAAIVADFTRKIGL